MIDAVSNANLYAILQAGFPADRERIAIETPASLCYSYDDLDRATACLANLLVSLNLPRGARVAVQVEKSPEALLLYLATLRAGLVYVPLNTAYRAEEIAFFLGDAQPAVVVCAPGNFEWVAPLVRQAADGDLVHIYTLDDARDGSLLRAAAALPQTFATIACGQNEPAAILYTSGTTGRSKGAVLTHGNLSSNARALHAYWGWTDHDVLLHMLPIFHIHGLFVASHGALLAGARMIWLPKLDIEQALRYLPRSTIVMGVPTYYVRLLAEPRFDRRICSGVRLFISGSAPLLTETFNQFTQRVGQPILERYGMSETGMLTSNPYHVVDGARVGGTVGRPLPGVHLRIVDDQGIAVVGEQIGHVQVRGPNVFASYWRLPEKTREEFTADSWFKTGDMGKWGDGKASPRDYLTIVGRSKDMIISGGYNVYPKEIEGLIDELPGVAESAVIGVPHADFGEAVVAVVVPQPGFDLDPGIIQAGLKARIANFKVPKRVHVVEQLPRNAMGKVQKNVLRDQFQTL